MAFSQMFSVETANGKSKPAPSKAELSERLVDEPSPTQGYRPELPSHLFYAYTNSTPPLYLFYWDWLSQMHLHPRVQMAMETYKSGISEAKVIVKSRNPGVQKFAQEQFDRLWSIALPTVQEGYDLGYGGFEPVYRFDDDGRLAFDYLKSFEPNDVRLLTSNHKYYGIRVYKVSGSDKPVDLWSAETHGIAKAFWYAHLAKQGRHFGWPRGFGAWQPWRRLAYRDGAQDVVDMAVYRFGIQGPVVWYDPKQRNVDETKRDPRNPSNKDAARAMAEQAKAGVSTAFPSFFDEKWGHKLWEMEWPEHVINVDSIVKYCGSLEDLIDLGIGVPPEINDSGDKGGMGYRGREIPMEAYLAGQTKVARDIVHQFAKQVVLPLVRWEFGDESTFDVDVEDLNKTRRDRDRGDDPNLNGIPGGPKPPKPAPEQDDPPESTNLATLTDGLPGKGLDEPAAQAVFEAVTKIVRPRQRELIDEIIEALTAGIALDRWERVREILKRHRDLVIIALAESVLGGSLAAMRWVSDQIPFEVPSPESGPPSAPPPRWTDSAFDDYQSPVVRLTLIDEAAKNLMGRQLMTRDEFDTLAREARQQAFTVAGVGGTDTLQTLRDSLGDAANFGWSRQTWRKHISAALKDDPFLSPTHQETVFRTNIQSAYSKGLDRVLDHPMVGAYFPYEAIHPILDNRVRPHHAALQTSGINGTNIYRRDDPTYQTVKPPSDYNCRCGRRPVSIEQASKAGVKEAEKWQETGKEPLLKAWVPLPPGWTQSPGFARLATEPPSKKLSHFERWRHDLAQIFGLCQRPLDHAILRMDTGGADASGHHHAPPGGITLNGKTFAGGEFIYSEDYAAATPEQKQQLDAHRNTLAGAHGGIPSVKEELARNYGPPKGKRYTNEAIDYFDAVGREIHKRYGDEWTARVAELKHKLEGLLGEPAVAADGSLRNRVLGKLAGLNWIMQHPPAGTAKPAVNKAAANVQQPASIPAQVIDPDKTSTASESKISRPGKADASEPKTTHTFKTSKGSTYKFHEGGTTTRNKSDHSGPLSIHDKSDQGEKARSDKTIFVSKDVASALSGAGLSDVGGKGHHLVINGNKATLVSWNKKENKWGASASGRDIEFSNDPKVGLAPVEMWGRHDKIGGMEAYSNQHAGNEIAEVSESQAAHTQSPDAAQPKPELPQNSAPAAKPVFKKNPLEAVGEIGERLQAKFGKNPGLVAASKMHQAFGDNPTDEQLAKAMADLPEDKPHVYKANYETGPEPEKPANIPAQPEATDNQPTVQDVDSGQVGKPNFIEHGKAYNVPVSDLNVDPERFQYKAQGIGSDGVTKELKGINKWDPNYAGIVSVWRDPADGRDYVVNGHHRYELAKRLGVDGLRVQYLDEPDADSARTRGALINIAEGRGTAIDAAKVLRDKKADVGYFKQHGVSVDGPIARDAGVLAKLSGGLFSSVVNERIPQSRALAIGRELPDHDKQDQLSRWLENKERGGRDFSDKVVTEMAREMAASTSVSKTDADSLFGDAHDESVFAERAELKAHLRDHLTRTKRDFQAVGSSRRAESVGKAGNVLNVEENQQRAKDAEKLMQAFDTFAQYKGPFSDLLNKHAGDLANVNNDNERKRIREQFSRDAGELLPQLVDAGGRTGPAVAESPGGSETSPPAVRAGSDQDGDGKDVQGVDVKSPLVQEAEGDKQDNDAKARFLVEQIRSHQDTLRELGHDPGIDPDKDPAIIRARATDDQAHAKRIDAAKSVDKLQAELADNEKRQAELKAGSGTRKNLFGDTLPKEFTSGPKMDQSDMFPGTPGLAESGGAWMDAAKDLAESRGQKIEQFHVNQRVKIGGKWHSVKRDGDGWKLEKDKNNDKIEQMKTNAENEDTINQWVKPATKEDLKSDRIHLWHGTTAKAFKSILRDGLQEGPRGLNAASTAEHAAQYPEETGAEVLILIRSHPSDLDVDPNDQIGETVADGLFPGKFGGSATVHKSEIMAAFDIENAKHPDAAISALNKGNLAKAIKAGAKIIYQKGKES